MQNKFYFYSMFAGNQTLHMKSLLQISFAQKHKSSWRAITSRPGYPHDIHLRVYCCLSLVARKMPWDETVLSPHVVSVGIRALNHKKKNTTTITSLLIVVSFLYSLAILIAMDCWIAYSCKNHADQSCLSIDATVQVSCLQALIVALYCSRDQAWNRSLQFWSCSNLQKFITNFVVIKHAIFDHDHCHDRLCDRLLLSSCNRTSGHQSWSSSWSIVWSFVAIFIMIELARLQLSSRSNLLFTMIIDMRS